MRDAIRAERVLLSNQAVDVSGLSAALTGDAKKSVQSRRMIAGTNNIPSNAFLIIDIKFSAAAKINKKFNLTLRTAPFI
jgi:hypothetical protein